MQNSSNAKALSALVQANVSNVGMEFLVNKNLETLEKQLVASLNESEEGFEVSSLN